MWKIILCLVIGSQICIAGFERFEVGVRPLSLGYAYTALANDIWAISYNPAGLSQLVSNQVGFYYSPEPFGLSELSTMSVALAFPLSVFNISLGVRKFGFELYREYSVALSLAKYFSGVGIGVNLCYYNVRIENYGSDATVGIDLGFIVKLANQLNSGVALKNLNLPTIGNIKEKLPQIFTFGLAYSLIQNCTICFDVQKETKFDLSPRLGFEYWLIEYIAIRGGWMNIPAKYTAGLGLKVLNFSLDYGFETHQDLGWTHCLSILIFWDEK